MLRLTILFSAALGLVLNLMQQGAQAAPIAIIDSGTDLQHDALKSNAWVNPKDSTVDQRDNDWNFKKDDVNGWNFAENNNKVIDYSYLGTFSQDPYRYFELQLKFFKGTITEEEIAWIRAKQQDENFIKEMGKFGNFVHGTHVAGIAAKDAPAAKIMAVKLMATEVKSPFFKAIEKELATNPDIQKGGKFKERALDLLIRKGIEKIAMAQSGMLKDIGLFVWFHKMKVANASFGSSTTQIKMLLEKLLKIVYRREPTDEETTMYATYMMQIVVDNGRQFAVDANETFFVAAAGNDGTDNDVLPTYPASVQRPNLISVAATFGYSKLASFSNYGATTVEVAAPGVGIYSSIPGNEYLTVSGTSQAAPFVTNAVGRMLDANANLSHAEIKKILMGTADYKDFLKGKVTCGGIVNTDRAVMAASNLTKMSLDDAILEARLAVKDVVDTETPTAAEAATLMAMPEAFSIQE